MNFYIMKRILIFAVWAFYMVGIWGFAQEPEETEDWSRKPVMILPGLNGSPPSDAIVLFDGHNLDEWTGRFGPETWKLTDGAIEVIPGNGSLSTKRTFGSVQLHIEWKTPYEITGDGQDRGNSGIYLMSLYEIQVLDSWDNETYYNGQAGSIYKQHIPLVNASLPPSQWQSYDIIFTAPLFDENRELVSPAFFTVFHNGVLIQNHVEVQGPTLNSGTPQYEYHEPQMPLLLQDHGNKVRYRNIWIREL